MIPVTDLLPQSQAGTLLPTTRCCRQFLCAVVLGAVLLLLRLGNYACVTNTIPALPVTSTDIAAHVQHRMDQRFSTPSSLCQ